MSDSSAERTEEATPRKKREARRRGEVAQSRDLSGTLVLLAAIAMTIIRHDRHVAAFERLFDVGLGGASAEEPLAGPAMEALIGAWVGLAETLLPFASVLVLAALAGPMLQVGPLLTFESMVPKPERMNPAAGLKKMFFSGRSWAELARTTVKFVAIAGVAHAVLRSRARDVVRASGDDVWGGTAVIGSVLGELLLKIILAMVALGLADLAYQRWRHGRDQRMTRDEVKREYRDQEGSPEQKGERRRMQQELAARCDEARVREEADVVIVNPIHFACALAYDGEEGAPRLVAKGREGMALRLRSVAERAEIPVRRDVGLARALFELEVDDEVPPELYQAVAIALDWVREIAEGRGETVAWANPGEGRERPATGLRRRR
ncbi:MAG: EscU/YscU/HrcU family type III secretion system export apparatus switch protein [Planctomycetota bacterium]